MAEKSQFMQSAGEQYAAKGDILDVIKRFIRDPVPLLTFFLIFIVILKVVFKLLGNWWPQFNNVQIGIGFGTIALVVFGVAALGIASAALRIVTYKDPQSMAVFFQGLRNTWKIILIVIILTLGVAWLVHQYPGVFGDFSILPRQIVFNSNIDPFSIVPIR